MKFLDKFNLVIFSIIILVLSLGICLLSFGWLDLNLVTNGINFIVKNTTANNISLVVAIILIILAIKSIFFNSYSKEDIKGKDGILLENENGKLLVSRDTLERSRKNSGFAPQQMMSFTHMATQSIPTVSCLSSRKAIFSFVPTPSVPLTRTGFSIPVMSSSNRPPKPPISEHTPGTIVFAICCFISSTALYPAVMSTPAAAYASDLDTLSIEFTPFRSSSMCRVCIYRYRWLPRSLRESGIPGKRGEVSRRSPVSSSCPSRNSGRYTRPDAQGLLHPRVPQWSSS